MNPRNNPDPAAPHVPSQWDWHYQTLQSIRELLLSTSAERMEEFEAPLEAPGMDMADSGTDEFDHDLALGLLAHEGDAVAEVDAAIQRIMDGSYGVCMSTGQPISDARLRAVPWTRYIKEAQGLLEERNLVGRPHLEPVESIQGPAPGGLATVDDPADEEPITIESRRRSGGEIRDFADEAGLTITPPLPPAP